MKQNDFQAEISKLKARKDKQPDIIKYRKEFDPKYHDVFTKTHIFKDRKIEVEVLGEGGKKETKIETIPLNRIGLPYQKFIVRVGVAFLYGNPVQYVNSGDQDLKDINMLASLKEVIKKAKMQFVDREIATIVSKYTECAELWYDVEGEEDYKFGDKSKRELKVKILNPEIEKLYPVFDDKDNMISFSREFTANNINYFVSYTKEKITTYTTTDGTTTKNEEDNPIKKIPVVYYRQEEVEWEDVKTPINRLEKIFVNAAESNDKFAFPILGLHGEVTGQFTKDDGTGKVIQFKGDQSRAEFLLPPAENSLLNDEIARLEDVIHMFSNTPNIFSLKNIQGFGNMLAGENAKFIFLSAHLKVMEKMSIYLPALQRRISILKAYLQMLEPSFINDDLEVEPVITPYVIDNEQEYNRFIMEMTGGAQLWSRSYGMEKLGIKDPKKMMQQIKEENESMNPIPAKTTEPPKNADPKKDEAA